MIFKAILIANATNVDAQAKELNAFIREYLSADNITGSTIVFYSKKMAKDALLKHVPTESVTLVRVSGCQPEILLKALETMEKGEKIHLYLFPSGFAGSELAVRWAYRKKGASLVQVKQVGLSGGELIATKTTYANHVIGTFRLTRKPYCISLARGIFEGQELPRPDQLTVTERDLTDLNTDRFTTHSKWIPAEKTTGLEAAKFLIAGGQGMDNKKNTGHLEKIADALGADFGVSRPVAMNAWAPMHRLVGVSGVMVKPEICIVAGVSGAAAFYAGIEKSKTIVAINTDRHAPIIKASDVAVIDDYKAVMAELVKIASK